MAPPKIRFLTKIYHPNIDRLGRICLDVLKSMRSAVMPRCLCQLTCASQLVPCPPDPNHPPLDTGTPGRPEPR